MNYSNLDDNEQSLLKSERAILFKFTSVMIKCTIYMIIFLVFAGTVLAQMDTLKYKNEKIRLHTVYAEGLGKAVYYSINYDLVFYTWKSNHLAFNAGFSYWPMNRYVEGGLIPGVLEIFEIYVDKSAIIPINLSVLLGKEHYFELGAGVTFYIPTERAGIYGSKILLATPNLSYRWQKENGGLFLRAGFTPLFKTYEYKYEWLYNFDEMIVRFGLGIGYSFKNRKKLKI